MFLSMYQFKNSYYNNVHLLTIYTIIYDREMRNFQITCVNIEFFLQSWAITKDVNIGLINSQCIKVDNHLP